MSDIRYFSWDYDTNTAIEYERLGECNGCGACCYARVEFHLSSPLPDYHEGGTTTDETGIWIEWASGDQRRFFKFKPVDTSQYEKCSMLNYDNRCRLHAYAAKKLIQSGWPFCSDNVSPFRECSYSFREINRFTFEPKDTPLCLSTATT